MSEYRFSREYGLTHREFFRSLPPVVAGREHRLEANKVVIAEAEGQVAITLGPEQCRKIALLEIPFTELTFEFAGLDEIQRERFMQRFNLYFRRGGG